MVGPKGPLTGAAAQPRPNELTDRIRELPPLWLTARSRSGTINAMVAPYRVVETPAGEARLHYNRARDTRATVVLGHGAGGATGGGVGDGVGDRDLAALAEALPAKGISVVRVEQPFRVAGRRVAPPPATLDACWIAAIDRLRTRTPLVVGGRSAGARVACRTARRLGAVGCVALAFPLHPPGRPEKSRAEELRNVRVPTLVVQGERDPFGGPDELPDGVEVAAVPGANHTFGVARSSPVSREEALVVLVEAVTEWVATYAG